MMLFLQLLHPTLLHPKASSAKDGVGLPWDTALKSHRWSRSDTSGVPYLLCKGLSSGILEVSAGVQYDQAHVGANFPREQGGLNSPPGGARF